MKPAKKVCVLFFLVLTGSINAQTKAFEVNVIGEGQPILLFPGFTCTGEVWNESVSKLSKNYECHVFTFAGFGEVAPIKMPWLSTIKGRIEDYVAERKLKDPVILGHSLGGTLALWLASEENNPYSKLILVDELASNGALMIPDFNSENVVYDTPYNKQMLEMDTLAFEKMASQMVTGMSLKPEKQEIIKGWMLASDRNTFVYGYTDLLKLDLREDVGNIKIPVTICGNTSIWEGNGAKII